MAHFEAMGKKRRLCFFRKNSKQKNYEIKLEI